MNFLLICMFTFVRWASSKPSSQLSPWWGKFLTPSSTQAPLTPTVVPQPEVPKAERYCECVPFYLCVNGTINTFGVGVIDVRIKNFDSEDRAPEYNVKLCPDFSHVCCKIPRQPTVTAAVKTTTAFVDTRKCHCIPYPMCPKNRVVVDGKGNTTLIIKEVGKASHSNCTHPLHVCCAYENQSTVLVSPTTTASDSYEDEASEGCHCMSLKDCLSASYGIGIIDVRMKTDGEFQICPHNPDLVCCNSMSELISSTPEAVNGTAETTTTVTTTTERPPSNVCGLRKSQGVGVRILGFKESQSQFAEFPWVSAVLHRTTVSGKSTNVFVGGGSLIHPHVVATAAHKVVSKEKRPLFVRLGEWDVRNTFEPLPHIDVEVVSVIIHPNFNSRALFHDVALLILKDQVKLAGNIQTICLAKSLNDIDGTSCVINGWGKDFFGKGSSHQVILKSTTLPLYEHEDCQKSLRKTRLGRYFRLHPSFICAGGEKGKDACTGDGGGPLACPLHSHREQYRLVGLTAWGIGCGEEGVPGVYASMVTDHLWVEGTIERFFPTPTTTPVTTLPPETTTEEYGDYYEVPTIEDIESDVKHQKKKKKKMKWKQRRKLSQRMKKAEKQEVA